MRVSILCAAAVVAGLTLAVPAEVRAQSLVYVVRHAERADGGAGVAPPSMSGTPADPSLSTAGAERAAKLAAMFADAGIRAIYVTEFKRTKETAAPLAAKLGVTPAPIASAATDTLIADMKRAHAGDVVLVVAHSNTIPAIVKALGGPTVTVGDNDYDGLFVVVPGTGRVSKIHY